MASFEDKNVIVCVLDFHTQHEPVESVRHYYRTSFNDDSTSYQIIPKRQVNFILYWNWILDGEPRNLLFSTWIVLDNYDVTRQTDELILKTELTPGFFRNVTRKK